MRTYEQLKENMVSKIKEYNDIKPTGADGNYTSQEMGDKKTILE